MADQPTTPHSCKGSLAIAEETTADCWNDSCAAAKVLAFAAVLAALRGGLPIANLAKEVAALERAGRVYLGMDPARQVQ